MKYLTMWRMWLLKVSSKMHMTFIPSYSWVHEDWKQVFLLHNTYSLFKYMIVVISMYIFLSFSQLKSDMNPFLPRRNSLSQVLYIFLIKCIHIPNLQSIKIGNNSFSETIQLSLSGNSRKFTFFFMYIFPIYTIFHLVFLRLNK